MFHKLMVLKQLCLLKKIKCPANIVQLFAGYLQCSYCLTNLKDQWALLPSLTLMSISSVLPSLESAAS